MTAAAKTSAADRATAHSQFCEARRMTKSRTAGETTAVHAEPDHAQPEQPSEK